MEKKTIWKRTWSWNREDWNDWKFRKYWNTTVSSLKHFTLTCFFYDKDDSNMKLHMRQTFQVQWVIEEIAQKIGDTKILAKFSTSDMIPIEAKYHCKCLAAYYNQLRNEQPTGIWDKNWKNATGKWDNR